MRPPDGRRSALPTRSPRAVTWCRPGRHFPPLTTRPNSPPATPPREDLCGSRVPFFCFAYPFSFFSCRRLPCPRPSRATIHVSQKVREGRLCAGMWRRDRHSGGVRTRGQTSAEISRSRQVVTSPLLFFVSRFSHLCVRSEIQFLF